MAIKTSKKIHKPTYVERVLRALSQIRQEHRKQSVHLATLRTQVRKNALADKDSLGPQWTTWVTKAVHKLEDYAIIMPMPPSGHITLSAQGKRILVAAKHDVLSTSGRPATLQQDVHIWKQVYCQISDIGRKRRYESITSPFMDDNDDEEHDPSGSTNTSKRLRTSAVSVEKSVSKMNKAQLKAALQSLQKQYLEATERVHAQEATTEEAEHLRTEVQEMQQNINTMRSQLEQLNRPTTSDEGAAQDLEGRHSRDASSGTHTIDLPPLSSITAQSRRPMEVTRTASGSFISNISKQPTPAPSMPGSPEQTLDDQPFNFGDNGLGMQDDNLLDDTLDIGPAGHPGLVTPKATPRKQVDHRHQTKEIEKYRDLIEEMKGASKRREALMHDKITALEADIASRDTAHRQFEESRTQLLAERGDLIEKVAHQDSQLSKLTDQVCSLRDVLSERDRTISSRNDIIQGLRVADTHTKQQLNSRIVEISNQLRERDSAHVVLIQEKEKSISQLERAVEEWKKLQATTVEELAATTNRCASLNEKLQAIETSNESLSDQLKAAIEDSTRLSVSVYEARSVAESLSSELNSCRDQLNKDRRTLEQRDSQLCQVEGEKVAVQTELSLLAARSGSLEVELEMMKAESQKLRSSLVNSEAQYELLAQDLSTKEASVKHAEAMKEAESARGVALSSEVVELTARLKEVQHLADAQSVDLTQNRTELNDLKRVLALKEVQVADLTSKLSATTRAQDILTERVEQQDLENGALHAQLTMAENQAKEQEECLEVRVNQWEQERRRYEDSVVCFQSALDAANTERLDLGAEAATLKMERDSVKAQLLDISTECHRVKSILDGQMQHTSQLENELDDAKAMLADADEEILALRQSKAVDDQAMEGLKAEYSKLREIQLASLNLLGEKIVSVQPTPVSHRRRSSVRNSDIYYATA